MCSLYPGHLHPPQGSGVECSEECFLLETNYVNLSCFTLLSSGEEPPESLFMKELKKRGITPTSLLEDTNNGDFRLGGEMTGENRDFSRRSAVSTEVNKSLSNQRERSMQLNSEGLEVNFLRILLESNEYAHVI